MHFAILEILAAKCDKLWREARYEIEPPMNGVPVGSCVGWQPGVCYFPLQPYELRGIEQSRLNWG